uniref:VOC domain-containing protein n=1 Tax=Oxyrrhis marina TaxID=2969 RepID=A0A7S3XGD1_OXYMA|mmetsp:Transcript_3615/g.5563  ORF Transcript_3615/g.5563 Transcript_3615/m.5563 type:complete len:153 (-) Transcript_3615:147-605(-)
MAQPLEILAVNHISRETDDVERLTEFYSKVFGLPRLERPDFGFGGSWFALPNGGQLHIIEKDTQKPPVSKPVQDNQLQVTHDGRLPEKFIRRSHHIALTVADIDDAKSRLTTMGIPFAENVVPGTPIIQLFVYDPDGNGIEIGNFDVQRSKL